MKRSLVIAALALAACARHHVEVKEATVEQVVAWTKAQSATVFDANTEAFREKNGVVPGAVRLSSFNEYAFSELGQDKGRQLVFYCTNRL